MSEANKRQVGGKHYKGRTYHGIPIEHWDVVVVFDLNYFQGQVTKYVMRYKDKNGLEDLHKARHFLDKLIETEEAKLKAAQDVEPKGRVKMPADRTIESKPVIVQDGHGFGHEEDKNEQGNS